LLLAHWPEGRLAREKGAGQMDVEYCLEFGWTTAFKVTVPKPARIGEEDVNLAVMLLCPRDKFARAVWRVDRNECGKGTAACCPDFFNDHFNFAAAPFICRAAINDDCSTAFRKIDCKGPTEAPAGAGDHPCLPVKIKHGTSRPFSTKR
jgi:hypothetical protein